MNFQMFKLVLEKAEEPEINTPSLIKDYKETLKKYNDSVEALARKYGGKLITVNSSMNIEEIILNEFSKRKVLY